MSSGRGRLPDALISDGFPTTSLLGNRPRLVKDPPCLSAHSIPSLLVTMYLHSIVSFLIAVAGVTAASPFSHAERSVGAGAAGLRLIKTSESDAGTWVREDDKIENYVAKGINFVDITDMTVRG